MIPLGTTESDTVRFVQVTLPNPPTHDLEYREREVKLAPQSFDVRDEVARDAAAAETLDLGLDDLPQVAGNVMWFVNDKADTAALVISHVERLGPNYRDASILSNDKVEYLREDDEDDQRGAP
jgi:hypothetical protein